MWWCGDFHVWMSQHYLFIDGSNHTFSWMKLPYTVWSSSMLSILACSGSSRSQESRSSRIFPALPSWEPSIWDAHNWTKDILHGKKCICHWAMALSLYHQVSHQMMKNQGKWMCIWTVVLSAALDFTQGTTGHTWAYHTCCNVQRGHSWSEDEQAACTCEGSILIPFLALQNGRKKHLYSCP